MNLPVKIRYPQFWHYAKYHYQMSGDVLADLSEVVADFAGISPGHVSNGDALILLTSAIEELYECVPDPIHLQSLPTLLLEETRNQRINRSFRLAGQPYVELTLEESLVQLYLSILRRVPMFYDSEPRIKLFDIGEPDATILPLNPSYRSPDA